MGFFQNSLMKKSFRYISEMVTAPEMSVELFSTPPSLSTPGYKFSDNLIRVAVSDRLGVFLLYTSIPSQNSADAYSFGTATAEGGVWTYRPEDLVFSPFTLDASFDEGIGILIESVFALSLLDIVRGSDDSRNDEDEVTFAKTSLKNQFEIRRKTSNRDAIVKVILAMGKQHPSIALGSMFIS